MPNRHESSDKYRYGFNGMEKDDEVKGGDGNSIDFGIRMYDPRIGRLKSVDPNAKNLPSFSPYQYSRNNPIMLKENGMDGIIPVWLWRQGIVPPAVAGFIDAVADDVKGLASMAQTALAFNPSTFYFYTPDAKKVRNESVETTKAVFELATNPILRTLVLAQGFNSVKQKVANADATDYEYATGYGAWTVLSMFIGVGELNSLVKTGKMSKITALFTSKLSKASKIERTVVVKSGVLKRLTDLPIQSHHLLTKYGAWGKKFKRILKKYDLNIDSDFNKLDLHHQGPHPKEYHQEMYNRLLKIDKVAGGDKDKFLRNFKKEIKDYVNKNQEIIHHNAIVLDKPGP
jgi:RHS repeat-associated protein